VVTRYPFCVTETVGEAVITSVAVGDIVGDLVKTLNMLSFEHIASVWNHFDEIFLVNAKPFCDSIPYCIPTGSWNCSSAT